MSGKSLSPVPGSPPDRFAKNLRVATGALGVGGAQRTEVKTATQASKEGIRTMLAIGRRGRWT